MHTTTRFAGIVAGLTMSIGALSVPSLASAAAAAPPEPCAQQQTQLDRANAALERVTAVFERQQAKVQKAKREVEAADTARERSEAKRELAQARDGRDEAKENKRAQLKRVEKAQARLDACEASQPAEG